MSSFWKRQYWKSDLLIPAHVLFRKEGPPLGGTSQYINMSSFTMSLNFTAPHKNGMMSPWHSDKPKIFTHLLNVRRCSVTESSADNTMRKGVKKIIKDVFSFHEGAHYLVGMTIHMWEKRSLIIQGIIPQK